MITFGLLGALTIWFCHPAIFVLTGVAMVLVLSFFQRKEHLRAYKILLVSSIWMISFTASYFIMSQNLARNGQLLDYWDGRFMPFPPMSLSDVKWLPRHLLEIFQKMSISASLATLTFSVGAFVMFFKDRRGFLILISPLFVTLVASALHKYPFEGRLLLFMVPCLLLLIGYGLRHIYSKTKKTARAIALLTTVLLLSQPLYLAGSHLIKPRLHEEIRPVINYIRQNETPGDIIYLYYASAHAFRYYSEYHGLNVESNDIVEGVISREDIDGYAKDMDKLRGNRRVWVLFSHVSSKEGIDEKGFFLYHLDKIGARLDFFEERGASVYLYDLSKEA